MHKHAQLRYKQCINIRLHQRDAQKCSYLLRASHREAVKSQGATLGVRVVAKKS